MSENHRKPAGSNQAYARGSVRYCVDQHNNLLHKGRAVMLPVHRFANPMQSDEGKEAGMVLF